MTGSSRLNRSRVLAGSSKLGPLTVTAFHLPIETFSKLSLGQHTVSNRCQLPHPVFAFTGCVRPQAVGMGESLPQAAS